MLNQKFIENKYKVISTISENVFLIEIDKKKYILKEIVIPLSYIEICEQHDFIEYLLRNGVKTAKIVANIYKDGKNFEIQEYIESDKNLTINTNNLIKFISRFHNISYNYSKELSKKNYYNYEFMCRDYPLDKLLLGFKQKYYIFPRKKMLKKYNLVSYNRRKYFDEIINMYDYCYKYFVNHYKVSDCIIHNDITSNNVIAIKDDFYIIDFDLSIKSSVYVDFVDSILKRYDNIYDMFDAKNNIVEKIYKYVNIYNKYSKKFNLTVDGVLSVIILKLVSFNGYVLLNEYNKKEFNINLKKLYLLIKKIFNILMEVKNDKKS